MSLGLYPPRDTRWPHPFLWARTRTPVSDPHHVRLRNSSAPPRHVTHPRWLRRGVCRIVPPPTTRRAVPPLPRGARRFLIVLALGAPLPALFHHAVTFTPLIEPKTRRPPDDEVSASARSSEMADKEMS